VEEPGLESIVLSQLRWPFPHSTLIPLLLIWGD
jgi:hypothetical protein